ncbi:MAG: response regulator [Bacillota bacterium]|nr:response regulator [Bacillota bacterium]
MLKILIVDDEVIERKALAKIVTRFLKNIKVIGEAPNGRKAIEMAKEHKPDIIFMDIKMPGVDGVQAVKEITKIEPKTRFIIFSAFNTFEYAKEVMQQGVKEYILKPSSKEDILSSIQRVSDEILEERKQKEEQKSLKENLDRAVSIAQKEWVSSLLMNQVQDISFEEWSQLLGVEITCGYIMLFFLQPKDSAEISANEKQLWNTWLKENLKLIVKKQEVIVGPITDNQIPVLFLNKKNTEKFHFKKSVQSLLDKLLSNFREKGFNAVLKIGIGFPYYHANELNQSFHEAVAAMQQIVSIPNRKYLFGDQLGFTEILSSTGIHVVEKKLLDAIRQGDINQVLVFFEAFVAELTVHQNVDGLIVKKSFDELFILISRMLHELGINYRHMVIVGESEDISGIVEKEKSQILAAVQHVQVWRNNQAKGMLYKAKEYIEVHYADSVTLESVAEYVGLSPFYFSKLFKDRFGMTFVDYLTDIRIRHAKLDLVDQGKSLKEICFSIGYKDPNYFSRVFKKLTGLSPTEFRRTTIG